MDHDDTDECWNGHRTHPRTGEWVVCRCQGCRDRRREVRELELDVARRVSALLASGWSPSEIVGVTRRSSPRSSRAWMLVRIELVCLAGYWMSRSDRSDWLDEADDAAKGTGFAPGVTIPGWLDEWVNRKANGFIEPARLAVRHLREALDPHVASVGDPTLPFDLTSRIEATRALRPDDDVSSPDGRVVDLWGWVERRELPTGPLGA